LLENAFHSLQKAMQLEHSEVPELTQHKQYLLFRQLQ